MSATTKVQSSSQQASSGSKKPTVFISAADSYAGAALVNSIAELGADKFNKVILAVDSSAEMNNKLDTSKMPNIEVKKFDFKSADAAKFQEALKGVDVVALIPPKVDSKFAVSRAILKACDQSKVNLCVLLTWTGTNAIDTAKGTFTQLAEVKKLEDEFQSEYKNIRTKTVVRANFYVQNFVSLAKQIIEEKKLPVPTEKGKFAPLDAHILGKALSNLLCTSDSTPHHNQTYTFTGPEAFDAEGIAQCLSKATGSDVKVKPVSMDEARDLLTKARPPLAKSEIDTLIETYTLIQQGRLDQTSSDIMKVLDIQRPTLVETFKREMPMMKKVANA